DRCRPPPSPASAGRRGATGHAAAIAAAQRGGPMMAADPLICDICGEDFDEDTEYGICLACEAELIANSTPEELAAVRFDMGLEEDPFAWEGESQAPRVEVVAVREEGR